jgi:transposase
MIGASIQTRIFLCTQDTDMRRSFDSLRGIIQRAMHLDPLSGCLFVFKNKHGDRIKVVYWDTTGFAMWYKVLQKGTFKFPDLQNLRSAGLEIDPSTLQLILDGIDLGSIRRQPRFRLSRNQIDAQISDASAAKFTEGGSELLWQNKVESAGSQLDTSHSGSPDFTS